MSPNTYPNGSPTVVAVDRDKNTTSAVQWAIEHLLLHNATLVVVHVRTKNTNNQGPTSGPPEGNPDSMEGIFSHIRAYGARKRIATRVVILEGADVHSALLEFINGHRISNIVLGASSRSPMTRKFWTHDVPTMINKAAPDFCNVYVIAKGKIQSVRPAATKQTSTSIPTRLPSPNRAIVRYNNQAEIEDSGSHRTPPAKWSSINETIKSNTTQSDGSKASSSSLDSTEVSVSSKSSRHSSSSVEPGETVKDEKDEKYQTKEETLALIQVERAKCRAAIEVAEKAQRLAEKESQRRRHVEMKARQEAKEKNRALEYLSTNDVRYRKYGIEEIERATNRFSRAMKIGEGGYGPVYKGKLDHTKVAIKVLKSDAAQGRKQFQQEVEVLSIMRHPNMVLLMGACPEYGCLVYEYMDNGSLEDRLYRKGNTPPIPWQLRFKIAADIATGLLFLHQAKPEPLVHRDLKPANILLDRHYTCKISDVGLARLVPAAVADSVTQYHMTSAAGTFCYIDPEYQQTGKLGTKSDIYSLGVMLLQIITARPPMGLTHQVERAIEKDGFADLLDPTVEDWPVEEALGYARLSLRCAELRKKDRPDLAREILPELSRLKQLGMERMLSHRRKLSV